ncbi:hypothetical protein LINGRAPRIM_LOCUS2108 [Linum grandiflorum]
MTADQHWVTNHDKEDGEITSHTFFSVPSISGDTAKSYLELSTQKFEDNVRPRSDLNRIQSYQHKFEDNVRLRSDVMTADQPWVTNPDEEDREFTSHTFSAVPSISVIQLNRIHSYRHKNFKIMCDCGAM